MATAITSLSKGATTHCISTLSIKACHQKNNGKSNENMGSMCDTHIEVGWLESCLVSTCGGTPNSICVVITKLKKLTCYDRAVSAPQPIYLRKAINVEYILYLKP
jgi:hypothetical protein